MGRVMIRHQAETRWMLEEKKRERQIYVLVWRHRMMMK